MSNIQQNKYIDREKSWLTFNARVLQEAADESVPLLDRLRFLGIFSNNLDEYKAVSREAKEVLQQYYVPSNKVVTSWLSNFRSICEKVLSGNSNSLGDLKVPVASLKG